MDRWAAVSPGYRQIPVTPKSRVIVDNDFAGDPDGLLALAHHLLTDAAIVRGVTTTSIAAEGIPGGHPARDAVLELVQRLGVTRPPVSDDVRVRFEDLTAPTDGSRII